MLSWPRMCPPSAQKASLPYAMRTDRSRLGFETDTHSVSQQPLLLCWCFLHVRLTYVNDLPGKLASIANSPGSVISVTTATSVEGGTCLWLCLCVACLCAVCCVLCAVCGVRCAVCVRLRSCVLVRVHAATSESQPAHLHVCPLAAAREVSI